MGPALERVLRLENLLRESGSRGLTVRELTSRLDEESFPVDKRTVQRDLQTLSYCRQISCTEDAIPRYFATVKTDPRLRLLSRRLSADRDTAGNSSTGPLHWRSAEEYAESIGRPLQDVLESVQAGVLNGLVLRGRWFVLEFVTLDIPDRKRPERAVLRIAVRQSGNCLSAGTEVLELPLTYDPNEISVATGAMMPAAEGTVAEAVTVTLGGQPFVVDTALQSDLAAALFLWQVEVDLGDLLEHIPHESG